MSAVLKVNSPFTTDDSDLVVLNLHFSMDTLTRVSRASMGLERNFYHKVKRQHHANQSANCSTSESEDQGLGKQAKPEQNGCLFRIQLDCT